MRQLYLYSMIMVLALFSCKGEEETPQPQGNQDLDPDQEVLANASFPLENTDNLDVLLEEIGDSRYVLLGEASHGTAEYYTWRAEISKRLIKEKGFTLIAVEGDWPDLYRLNQYIRNSSSANASAEEVLQQMDRWPTWMWANQEVADFGEWLHQKNQHQPADQQLGFYGLDVYSFWDSMEEVLAWLEDTDPVSAEIARNAYACLETFGQDEWAYAQANARGNANCADELISVLDMVQQKVKELPAQDEAAFNALQNALTVVNAERYYVNAVRSNAESWNIRDRHMVETIQNLQDQHGNNAKIIIWEHNTHIGDARATSMAGQGMVNVGQLMREQYSQEGVYIVGFGSYSGTVVAASGWGESTQEMQVPQAKSGSWEALLHSIEPADKIIILNRLEGNDTFMEPLGHRAIGVVYNPQSEQGNYVPSILPERYDAFLFIDETHALNPLSGRPGARIGGTHLEKTYFNETKSLFGLGF